MLDSSHQEAKRLFALADDNAAGDDNQVYVDSFKQYFFRRVKIKNCNIEIDGGNFFMINQLMTQLSNTTKSEKYQQDKVVIIQLVVYWIFLILKKITD